MNPHPSLCVCGWFEKLAVYDEFLSPLQSVSTSPFNSQLSSRSCRIVQVPDCTTSETVVAVSDGNEPYRTRLYDPFDDMYPELLTIEGCGSWGLASISGTRFRNPLIVARGSGQPMKVNSLPSGEKFFTNENIPGHIVVVDASQGTAVGWLEDCPSNVFDVSVFPEWANSQIFVGGGNSDDCSHSGELIRFDLQREGTKIGTYFDSDLEEIHGVDADVPKGFLVTVGFQQLKIWDRDNFGSPPIRSIGLSKPGYSVYVAADSHQILVGTHKEIEFWDSRRLVYNIGRIRLKKGSVESIDRLNRRSYVFGTDAGELGIISDENLHKIGSTKLPSGVFGVVTLKDVLSGALICDTPAATELGKRFDFVSQKIGDWMGCARIRLVGGSVVAVVWMCFMESFG